MKLYFLSMVVVFSSLGIAAEIEGVQFAPTRKVEEQDLKLFGVGLRQAVRFGISFRVYVAGLYVGDSISEADKIESSKGIKFLELVFLRRVDKASIIDAWSEAMFNNCVEDCDHYRDQLRPVNDLMVDILNKGQIRITFLEDSVKLEIDGREKKQGTIQNAHLARNLLRAFIGPKPGDEGLKKGLLTRLTP